MHRHHLTMSMLACSMGGYPRMFPLEPGSELCFPVRDGAPGR
jgi:hypothetical protein